MKSDPEEFRITPTQKQLCGIFLQSTNIWIVPADPLERFSSKIFKSCVANLLFSFITVGTGTNAMAFCHLKTTRMEYETAGFSP